MDYLPEATPAAIRQVLEARGWTQSKAAALIGVAPTTMRRYLVEDGPSKLNMPPALFELLLLKAQMHPLYIIVPRDVMAQEPPKRGKRGAKP